MATQRAVWIRDNQLTNPIVIAAGLYYLARDDSGPGWTLAVIPPEITDAELDALAGTPGAKRIAAQGPARAQAEADLRAFFETQWRPGAGTRMLARSLTNPLT